MILIISEANDLTTNEVIDWLLLSGVTFERVNPGEAAVVGVNLQDESFELKINDKIISSQAIDAVWYRRGGLEFNFELFNSDHPEFNRAIHKHLYQEYEPLKNFVYTLIKQKKSINSDLDTRLNKLTVLQKAKKWGFETPKSIICSTRQEVADFMASYTLESVITKSIQNGLSYWDDEVNVEEYTSLITSKNLPEFPTHFFPSLIQENIAKKYEIRTFFLDGKSTSIAAFTQANPNTRVDSRKSNLNKVHRTVPFALPEFVDKKLTQLMHDLDLNSGSIDFIYTTDNRFVFLEVNPVGQFAQVSYPGNYHLEKRVSDTLIKLANYES